MTMRLEPLTADDAKALVRAARADVAEEEADAIAAARRRQPVVPAGARGRADRRTEDGGRRAAGDGRGRRDEPHRPAERRRPRAPPLGLGARPGVSRRARGRGRRGRGRGGRLRCLEPAGRVRRARPGRSGGFRFRHALIRDAAYVGPLVPSPGCAPRARRRRVRAPGRGAARSPVAPLLLRRALGRRVADVHRGG